MGELEVYIECDAAHCAARSREIWTKHFDDNVWPLTFCGHHADKHAVALQAQGFNPLESEVMTR